MSFKDCISTGFKDCISTYRFWNVREEEELILRCSSHHRNHTEHHNSGIYWTDEEAIEAAKYVSDQTNEEFADWQMIPWLVGLGHRLEREDGHEPREIQQIINLLRQIYSDNLRMRELIDNLRGIGESPTHARRVGRPYTKDCIDSLKISLRLLAKQMDRALDTQELSDNE